jgi:hypothetical protein
VNARISDGARESGAKTAWLVEQTGFELPSPVDFAAEQCALNPSDDERPRLLRPQGVAFHRLAIAPQVTASLLAPLHSRATSGCNCLLGRRTLLVRGSFAHAMKYYLPWHNSTKSGFAAYVILHTESRWPIASIPWRLHQFGWRFFHLIVSILMLAGGLCAAAFCAEFAVGSAPSCPTRAGSRKFRSAEVQAADVRTYIVGTASRQGAACRRTTEIRIQRDGAVCGFMLSAADKQDIFTIVDFSPDRSQLFLYREKIQRYPDEEFRNIEIAMVPVGSGRVSWQNIWSLMRWSECDAAIDPLGFTSDGKVVIRARPSVMAPPRRRSCVSTAGRYTIDLLSRTTGQLADPTNITAYSKTTLGPWQTCKGDPDLIGACFTVHGRLSAWNGTPTYRIWRIGTRRILGVSNDILPESLAANMSWGVEASGNFLVCPFSREHAGRMQQVCVESVSNLKYRRR